jgi:plastocyanin
MLALSILLGISLILNVVFLRSINGWRSAANQMAEAAQAHSLQLDLTFYMLTKKAGISADEEKKSLASTISEMAFLPASVKVKMADELPFMSEKSEKRMGFH